LHSNCRLKQGFEGEWKGREGTKSKLILDDVKEIRMYWILRQEALDSLYREVDLEEVMSLS
jgi:hypothetical protein